ncbi:MAG TPA: DMT family transporter [Solirubrobacteraceae bacterium]
MISVAIDDQRQRGPGRGLPVPVTLGVSMIAAGVVYPVTDAALHHASPTVIATLRALAGGSTDWGRPSLDAQLVFLILGGQVLVYVGFNAALGRWPSTRVYAWTFLVPAVAVVIEAVRGALPSASAMVGVALVIMGVAIVNLPRAEGPSDRSAEGHAFDRA